MMHPVQPLHLDPNGKQRFLANAIVEHLLSTHPTLDMNSLACMTFTKEDRQQFAQLIGYSLSGYSSLSYVDDIAYNAAVNSLGMSPEKAKIAALTQKLEEVEHALSLLREPLALLYAVHPDDLKTN